MTRLLRSAERFAREGKSGFVPRSRMKAQGFGPDLLGRLPIFLGKPGQRVTITVQLVGAQGSAERLAVEQAEHCARERKLLTLAQVNNPGAGQAPNSLSCAPLICDPSGP